MKRHCEARSNHKLYRVDEMVLNLHSHSANRGLLRSSR